MRVVIYCFSGTGNTRWACETFARELMRLGHTADLFPIKADCPPPPPIGYQCMIVGYPVHAFNAPAPVLKFLKKLPPAQKYTPVYLLRTSGEPLELNSASGIVPIRILKEKGYVPRGEFHYVMPYNIIFRHSDGMAARMRSASEGQIPKDALAVSSGKGELSRVGPFRRMVAFALRIEHPAMPIVGRGFKATEACVGCGLCASNCPQGNITMVNGRPKFGNHCVSCMSCSFRCPKDAVRISLLNGWRVNGAYSFDAAPASDDEVCKYCHRSYVRYFHRMEGPRGETKDPVR